MNMAATASLLTPRSRFGHHAWSAKLQPTASRTWQRPAKFAHFTHRCRRQRTIRYMECRIWKPFHSPSRRQSASFETVRSWEGKTCVFSPLFRLPLRQHALHVIRGLPGGIALNTALYIVAYINLVITSKGILFTQTSHPSAARL